MSADARGSGTGVVDAQLHIWGADTPERPWAHAVTPHRPLPFSAEDALREMDGAGVQSAILVPPWWEGERNDLALAAAKAHPRRFAVMGLFDAEAADARARLAAWRAQPGMLGFRFSSQDPKYRTALADGRMDWAWREAERASIPVMLSLHPEELDRVARLAARHPGLRIAIDHLARQFREKDAAAFPNMQGLLALAKWPNIAVKASGMPAYTAQRYPYPSMRDLVRRVYDAFGPQRVFWGSDFTKLPCSYRQSVTMFTAEMSWLRDDDLAWVMGRGLCAWLGWTP
ncbi:MAG TPA: amidohydrolase family protein [Casimicrobiaceae bacterium]|nr:amidohydrolase family protein [Casimicrobiaceae bacterium]